MSANIIPLGMNFLVRSAPRIIDEVKGGDRVVYVVTSKPPGTIERPVSVREPAAIG